MLTPTQSLFIVGASTAAIATFRALPWLRLRAALSELQFGRPRRYRARLRLLARRVGAPPSRRRRFFDAVGLFWEGRFEKSLAALAALESDGFGPLLGGSLAAMQVAALLLLDRTDDAAALLASRTDSIRYVTSPPRGVPRLSTLEGIVAFKRDDLAQARATLEATVDDEPVAHLAQLYLAAIAQREARSGDARSHLRAAIDNSSSLFVADWARSASADFFPDAPVVARTATRIATPAVGNFRAWLRNLRAGLSILIFRASAARTMVAGLEQTVWLMLTNLVVLMLLQALTRPSHPFFVFNYALALLAPIPFVVVVAFFAAAIVSQREIALRVACGFYAALPWLLALRAYAETSFPLVAARICDCALGFWALAIFLSLVLKVGHKASFARVLATGPCFALLWLLPMWGTNFLPIWFSVPDRYPSGDDEADDPHGPKHQAVAERFFEQSELLHAAENDIQAERPGVDDLYFVGFAAWGAQDVFYRETKSAQRLMDSRFDTQGRSLIFSNDETTRDNVPAATSLNLKHALGILGTKMNRNEDILFVYLTSHGSKEGLGLRSTDAPELLGDAEITPRDLRAMLDRSGVVSRVVVVAGCESGVFIDALKNDDTVVATSSAVDRVSYGCAIGRDFTEFGRAFFAEQLLHQQSIVGALQNAIASIRDRETDAGLEQSNPQLWVGPKIAPKLEALRDRRAK